MHNRILIALRLAPVCGFLILCVLMFSAGCDNKTQQVDNDEPDVQFAPKPLTVLFVDSSNWAGADPAANETAKDSEKSTVEGGADEEGSGLVGSDSDAEESTAESLGQRIAREWSARRDGTVTVVNKTLSELVGSDFEIDQAIDVVVFNPLLMGELMSREMLRPVPEKTWKSEDITSKTILRFHQTKYISYAGENYAVPLGSPHMVMMYRSDILDALGAKPPTTWREFRRLNQDLQAATDDDMAEIENPTKRVLFPLAAGSADTTLLAVATPMARNRGTLSMVFETDKMEPTIGSPPFVEALNIIQLAVSSGDQPTDLTPAQVYREMLDGKAAVAFGWPSAGFDLENVDAESVDKIRIASLPGARRFYDQDDARWRDFGRDDESQFDYVGFDGLVAGVTEQSKRTSTAFEFVAWLSSNSISSVVLSSDPNVGPFRDNHLGDLGSWTGSRLSPEAKNDFGEVVDLANRSSRASKLPPIPRVFEYRKALDDAVRSAIEGGADSEAALKKAAQQWGEISEAVGVDQQRGHLRRSEGF